MSSGGRGQRGTLEQLPDGRWRARYREQGRNGKRPQKVFDGKREAAAWLKAGIEEADRVLGGDTRPLTGRRESATTGSEGVKRFLATVDVAASTKRSMTQRLRVFEHTFGDRALQSIETDELEAWRLTISPGWRFDVFADTRRMFESFDRWAWLPAGNPTSGIRNRKSRAPEVRPIAWADVLTIAGEIDRRLEHVPILAAGTGLRPEEWLALERGDVDLEGRVLHVRRVWSSGKLTPLGADGAKSFRQRRRVPLRQDVIDALRSLPRRIDTDLIVPAMTGRRGGRRAEHGYLHLRAFRDRYWKAAFEAAGLPLQNPYAMRHTYATESIAADVGLFELSRFMGTSLAQIDRTYGHLVDDAEERNREKLDAYDDLRRVVNE